MHPHASRFSNAKATHRTYMYFFKELSCVQLKRTKMNTKIHAGVVAVSLASFLLAGCSTPMYPDQSQNYPVQQTYPAQQAYPQPSYEQRSYPQPSYSQPQYPSQQTYQSQPYPSQQRRQEAFGTVDSIQILESNANSGPGLGAVAGALVGGLLGNQVGKGNGRTAATVAGAIGGGLVGNNVESSRRQQGPAMYQVRVRLDDGSIDTLTQDNVNDLGVGSRVRIDSGRVYRY